MPLSEVINQETLNAADQQSQSFLHADPFKYLLLKDFLNPIFLKQLMTEFPIPDESLLRNEFGGVSRKHEVHDLISLGENFKRWDETLKSEQFIAYLQQVSGIDGLIYDPEYHGAGTHNNLHGQSMDVHIDFNLHRTTNYHRRLNLIVYLNDEWEESWGGVLELHKDPWGDVQDYYHSIPPLYNHAVLFETNEYSWHGFDHINLPDNKQHLSRKSLTVYYYSKERPAQEIAPKHGTIYVQKSMPRNLMAGDILTQETFSELEENFADRNLYLKGLYRRETNLLTRIQGLEHRLNSYADNFRLQTTGPVIDIPAVQGVLPNGKVASLLLSKFRAECDLSQVNISIVIPEFIGINHVQINVAGQSFEFNELSHGPHTLHCPCMIQKNTVFPLKMSCSESFSPFEKGVNNDKMKFGFNIRRLDFIN